ncbi:MAG: arginase family protein [Rhizobium sp.]
MGDKGKRTLRLHMPQWQGGALDEYHLSSQLLSWLLPPSGGSDETVPVVTPDQIGRSLRMENGMLEKTALLDQAKAARQAIERHMPDRILTIGGDCLVDLAPIAYLNKRYEGRLGVLWIDAHPDVQTAKETHQGNAQVLGMLLGRGDPDFVAEVDVPVDPACVMYAGLDQWSPSEDEVLRDLSLRRTGSEELSADSAPVMRWLEENRIDHLAVHLDVDAIIPARFGPILFNKPNAEMGFLSGVPRGRLEPDTVIRLLNDVATRADIVGLAITEYISWDVIQTRQLLARLPLIGVGPTAGQ